MMTEAERRAVETLAEEIERRAVDLSVPLEPVYLQDLLECLQLAGFELRKGCD